MDSLRVLCDLLSNLAAAALPLKCCVSCCLRRSAASQYVNWGNSSGSGHGCLTRRRTNQVTANVPRQPRLTPGLAHRRRDRCSPRGADSSQEIQPRRPRGRGDKRSPSSAGSFGISTSGVLSNQCCISVLDPHTVLARLRALPFSVVNNPDFVAVCHRHGKTQRMCGGRHGLTPRQIRVRFGRRPDQLGVRLGDRVVGISSGRALSDPLFPIPFGGRQSGHALPVNRI